MVSFCPYQFVFFHLVRIPSSDDREALATLLAYFLWTMKGILSQPSSASSE